MSVAKRNGSLAERLKNTLELDTLTGSTGLFAEEPVSLDVFIHDKKYMNQPNAVLGEYQYALVRHMEQIYFPSMYPFMVENFGEYWNPVRYVNYLYLMYGKGSGKNFCTQIAVARIAYLWLCLNDPLEYFDLSSISEVQIINIAMNSSQAQKAFFRPLGNALKKSPWFQDKVRSEITDSSTSIRLEKQLELLSGHSLAANFEGYSPIAVVLDEISGFQSDEQKASRGNTESERSAEFIFNTLRTSASTRFPENFKLAAISYPRYLNDPIMNLVSKGRKDIEEKGEENSLFYVDGPRATWEVNPRYKKYEMITIPETVNPVPNLATILGDYQDNAALARSKYECLPERAANRYMRNDSALSNSFPKQDDDWVPPLQMFYHWGVDHEGSKAEDSWELANTPGWQVSYQFGPQLKPMEGAVYGIHVDLAVTGDRAGIAMCHVKNWERREHMRGEQNSSSANPDYAVDDRPIVKVDFVNYYEADMQAKTDDNQIKPREIQLRWARNLILELRKRGFTIGLVTFDSYQSVDNIQILETWGIPADTLSMDRNIQPYANLREIIYDGRLEGYFDPILQIELESLNLLPSGKLDHPPGGSKDLSDALCGAVTNAIVLGGDEGEAPEEIDVNTIDDFTMSSPWNQSNDFWGNIDFNSTSMLAGFR